MTLPTNKTTTSRRHMKIKLNEIMYCINNVTLVTTIEALTNKLGILLASWAECVAEVPSTDLHEYSFT